MEEEAASKPALPDAFLDFLKENGLDPSIYSESQSTPRYIRLKPGFEDRIEEIEAEIKRKLEEVEWLPGFYALPPDVQIANSNAYREEKIYGIDAASGAAVSALSITAGDHVLDLCAAPEDQPLIQEVASSSNTSSSSVIHSEINQNLRLCSVLLNEFNYLPWSRAISLALGGRSKLGYVNGSIKAPEPSSTSYGAWHANDQLVMSWILNSMEPKLSELFSYSDSSHVLWESIKEMYGSQNNAARIFQLKKDLTGLRQGDQPFVQHLGSMKSMWNELDLYRPHTTDSAALLKRADEDKVFQLLASLGAEYEDLRSHLLMNVDLPSFNSVCQAVQREETRRKVMHIEPKSNSEARVFISNHKHTGENFFIGKKADWKCTYCNMKGHIREKCWILHPELKPKFDKEGRMIKEGKGISPKALHSTSSLTGGFPNFTANPIDLINEFASFLQRRGGTTEEEEVISKNPTAMLGKFAGFLNETTTQDNVSGSSHPEEDW